jgi:hypothetical protein
MTTESTLGTDDDSVAEVQLAADVQAVDVSNPDYSSPRANAFQAMRTNWNAWRSDDDRWWAVGEILTYHELDLTDERETVTKAKLDGLEACAIAANLIGCGADLATSISEVEMCRLELAVATLSAITTRLRLVEYVETEDARAAVLNG